MRKKYRSMATILQSVGIFFLVAVLSMYYVMVIVYLNGVRLKGVLLLNTSHRAAATYGYFLMWVSCFLQLGAILLSVLGGRSSQEELVEEAREQAKFEAEMGAFGGAQMGNYGQQGMQPQMQPHMQMYQTGMGGLQQPGMGWG
mmetsp:Transcript_115770/g.314392  ORF Transcript_115770/g.314392 Transcript_115770/m.314392 type:complete len:143 (-) Transcript_115770:30-458(-)